MVVQQGLTTAEKLAIELLRINRDKRRAFTHLVVNDLLGGVRSLGELDVDGIQHSWASQIVGDAVRQNAVSIKGKTGRHPAGGLLPAVMSQDIGDTYVSGHR
ncbi:MAG: hypothetical protein ACXWDI_06215 [Nocardioides sp.]